VDKDDRDVEEEWLMEAMYGVLVDFNQQWVLVQAGTVGWRVFQEWNVMMKLFSKRRMDMATGGFLGSSFPLGQIKKLLKILEMGLYPQ
jgi:hypothetical protein